VRPVLAWLALGTLFALALSWAARGREPLRFADSESYLFCARQPLGADFFWSARAPMIFAATPTPEDGLYRNRPFLVPLLWRLSGLDPARIVLAQRLGYGFAAAAGIVLIVVALPLAWPARAGVGALLAGLALAWNLTGWSQALLTEAIVLALLWLFVGGWYHFLAREHRWTLGLGTTAAVALLFARDSAAFLVVPALAGSWLLVLRRGRRELARPLGVATAIVLSCAALAHWGMVRGGRAELPLLNVLFHRVAPDAAALDWWRARGLPWSAELEPFRGRYAFERDLELFRDDRHRALREWFAREGRGLFFRFLATHPGFVLRETGRGAADLFGSDLATYVGLPPGGALGWLDRLERGAGAGLCALILAAALVASGRRRRELVDLAPLLLAVAFLVHGLAVFHADAAEPERHCFQTLVGLQLAALLALAGALARRGGAGDEGPRAAAGASG